MDWLVWVARILWACRFSALSGLAGLLLFWGAVPAQNLFDDLSFTGGCTDALVPTQCPREFAFWTGVFVAALVAWALPIYFGARMMLDDDFWILSRAQAKAMDDQACVDSIRRRVRRRHRLLILGMPILLGLVPFAAIALGITLGTETDKGASNLQEGPLTNAQAHLLLIADAVTAFAAFVAMIALTLSRDTSRPRSLNAIGWILLPSTLAFFVVIYFFPLVSSLYVSRALLIPLLFGSLVMMLSMLQRWADRSGVPILMVLVLLALGVSAANVDFHALRTIPRTDAADDRLKMHDAVAAWLTANGCTAPESCKRRPVVIAIDGGASRAAFTAATFVGAMLDRTPKVDGEAETPSRRIFAISGVSGGAFGAAVIQAAVADAQDAGAAAVAPCRTAERTWFGYVYGQTNERKFRWQECLQALTSGDYLSPTIIGLAFRDFVAPKGWIEDRAVLLEQAFERHYDYTLKGNPSFFATGAICDPQPKTSAGGKPDTGLCRRIGHPRAFLDRHGGGWMPLLLLNGTSVRTGHRIVASDIAPGLDDRGTPLFPEAFDLGELMSSPCANRSTRHSVADQSAYEVDLDAAKEGKTVRTNKHGVCGGAAKLDGGDLRLSTAALTSARFPLISPAGAFTMKDTPFGDRVVDGGYFENSGLTTALEITDALTRAGLEPILVSIANEPAQNDKDAVQDVVAQRPAARALAGDPVSDGAGLPRRPSSTPLALYAKYDAPARALGLLSAPLDALLATRDGHASETEGLAEKTFAGTQRFFRIHVDETPDLQPVPQADPYDLGYCKDIWDRRKKGLLSMAKVSMSWWLSALVQSDLDAQKCSVPNQIVMNRLMRRLCEPQASCTKPVE